MKKQKKPTRYKMNGMFRYLLICLMLFTGSAHAAEDDFDAVKKAAEQGDVDAQYTLVACTPEAIVIQDYAEAARWYQVFKSDRINDLHLTLAEKRATREAAE